MTLSCALESADYTSKLFTRNFSKNVWIVGAMLKTTQIRQAEGLWKMEIKDRKRLFFKLLLGLFRIWLFWQRLYMFVLEQRKQPPENVLWATPSGITTTMSVLMPVSRLAGVTMRLFLFFECFQYQIVLILFLLRSCWKES